MVFLLLLSGIILFTTTSDIEYKIELVDNVILKGQDAILIFEINNGWLSAQKYDIEFIYNIIDETERKSEPIGNLDRGQSYKDAVYLGSSELPPGKYTVWTEIKYYTEGKGRIKFLTLELTIY